MLAASSAIISDPKKDAATAGGARAGQKDEAVLQTSQRATQKLNAVDAVLERGGQ